MALLSPLARINHAQPTSGYAEALARLRALTADEGDALNPLCRTSLLDHGQQTEHAIVFIHGFTNCPYQFHQLAAQAHRRGWNALSLRLSGHGFADRLTTALGGVRPKDLIDITNAGLDIGRGLGQQLTLFGFSLGGVLAGWAAQHRADLDHAILASPAFGVRALQPRQRQALAYLLSAWPNFFQWWHPELKEKRLAPLHAYPRFGSRSLAAMLRLGLITQREAIAAAPKARAITVITNPCDTVVDNDTTAQIVTAWRGHGIAIETHQFPREWNLIHDLIDPTQPEQQVERVYPLLLEWMKITDQPSIQRL